MKRILLLTLGIVSLDSCKKDNTVTVPSTTDILTAKNWRVSSYIIEDSHGSTLTLTNVYATASPCYADNFIKFNADRTIVTDEGATKCDATALQTTTGSWSYDINRNELTTALSVSVMPGSFQSLPFIVNNISPTTLSLSRKRIDLQGVTTERIGFTAF
jgi:hypothetical protein